MFGRIVQPGREAGGALGQRLAQPSLHVAGFPVGRGALGVAIHRLHAQRHVPDQCIGVDRGRVTGKALGVFAKTIEGEPAFVAEEVERGCRPGFHPHRR